MNQFKVFALLLALTMMFVVLGNAIGGTEGSVVFLILAAAMNFGSYWFSDRIVLAMSGARPIENGQIPWLEDMVADLAGKAQLPVPRLYVINQYAPNAFATGRDPQHGVVAVTTGLLNMLDRDEVAGVVAHELAHIRHRDTLLAAIVATLAGAIAVIADVARFSMYFGGGRRDRDGGHPAAFLLMAIFMSFAAMLVRLAISRVREFKADAGAAAITHNPKALASALRRIEAGCMRTPLQVNEGIANLFISEPEPMKRRNAFLNLFSSHPDTAERVARLEEMDRTRQVPVF